MNKGKNAIGIIELSCIHKGFEVHDRMLKAADVETILARSICSGKYLVMVRGEIADVESSVVAAKETAQYGLVNATVIPNIDDKIFPALSDASPAGWNAPDGMLVVETFSVASCIKAADVAVKAAEIDILRIHVAMAVGGKGYVIFTGNIDALKSAQDPVLEFLKQEGSLVGCSLITQPNEQILKELI